MQEVECSTEMSELLIEMAKKPPLKKPTCYSVNQIEVLQTLGNYTFADQYQTNEFVKKVIKFTKDARHNKSQEKHSDV